MGTAYATIRLSNPRRPDLKPIEVNALADTGAILLCVTEEVRSQLQLEATSEKEATTADGNRITRPYVGPIRVQFDNRECYVGALVMGDEVLLGAVPMEDMDLIVIPQSRRVVINPLHPNFASVLIK